MLELEKERTLLRSQLRCRRCGTVIASVHRHDFQTCPCGSVSIDGGRDYMRVVGNLGDFEACSIVVEGEYNNQDARILLCALKDIAKGEGEFPEWAWKELERSGLVRRNPEDFFDYIGPPLAQRDDL